MIHILAITSGGATFLNSSINICIAYSFEILVSDNFFQASYLYLAITFTIDGLLPVQSPTVDYLKRA